jgi:hypothetical protein
MNIPHPHLHLPGLSLHAPKAVSHVGTWLRRVLGAGRYRPERHYMRGPGPKTRAKLGGDGRHQAD